MLFIMKVIKDGSNIMLCSYEKIDSLVAVMEKLNERGCRQHALCLDQIMESCNGDIVNGEMESCNGDNVNGEETSLPLTFCHGVAFPETLYFRRMASRKKVVFVVKTKLRLARLPKSVSGFFDEGSPQVTPEKANDDKKTFALSNLVASTPEKDNDKDNKSGALSGMVGPRGWVFVHRHKVVNYGSPPPGKRIRVYRIGKNQRGIQRRKAYECDIPGYGDLNI